MMIKIKISIFLVLTGQLMFAQNNLPVIRSGTDKVDIRDGNVLKKGTWRIVPEAKPDVYNTSNKKVTFITDIDSISFRVKPNRLYNFIILLNGRDSALTQIKYKKEKAEQSYLNILKNAKKYDFKDDRKINKFTYDTAISQELLKIRTRFRLDSVAGNGDELSRILNLLHWVHESFAFNGNKELPPYDGMLDLMTKCFKSSNTMYCGALAGVLNSCFQADGFKSRQVVCLPKDSLDFDCHSINIVYSRTLKKWLWVDPTNNAYIMNENGTLLSIAEVRERLIENKPLILNPDANLNRVYSRKKEDYLFYYMAKNLYAFECFTNTGGNSESNLLLPVEYHGVIPRTRTHNPKCTCNPDLFWANPD